MANFEPAVLNNLNQAIDRCVDNARAINVSRGLVTGHRHYVRKPNQQTRELWLDIIDIVGDVARVSVRQLFYQLVNRGYEKTEAFYARVDDAAIQMRLAGVLSFDKFVDGSRQRRQIALYDSLADAMQSTHDRYRENLWQSQGRRVEVWCEKDALSGFFLPICQAYGVPFVAVRGFTSMSLVAETAAVALDETRPTIVCYFGDHDPSGRSMSNNLEADFRWHSADITVKRIALNPDQISAHNLPTRPSKSSDSRTKRFAEEFGEGSVELDALPPGVLTAMIEDAITGHVDVESWNDAFDRQQENKALLGEFMRALPMFGTN